MRAVALLGPNAAAGDVAPYAAAGRVAIPTRRLLDPAQPADVALLFGGDGTMHRHLSSFVQAQIPVLVVPAGSGNDFARAIGLTTRERSMAAWRAFCKSQQNVRAIDVGEIAPIDQQSSALHLFCCVAGAGIDSEVNRRANRLPRWVRANGGYALSVLGGLSFRAQTITIECEDSEGKAETISEPALMCAFANANAYGHGMRIAPDARLDDGLLDVVFVRQTGKARLLALFPSVYFGAHMGLREVEHRRVTKLRISSEAPLDIYADGEFICRTPAEVSVRSKALKVIY